jgi:hypothetical protein
MFRPDFLGGPPDMFICGNHDQSKAQVGALLTPSSTKNRSQPIKPLHGRGS